MSRTSAALALVAVFSLGGCASTSGTKYTVTPQTQVTVRGGKKKAASQANYRVTPEESMRTGAGGGGSEK